MIQMNLITRNIILWQHEVEDVTWMLLLLMMLGIIAAGWRRSSVICSPRGSIVTLQDDSDQRPGEQQPANMPVRRAAVSRWWRLVLTRGEGQGPSRNLGQSSSGCHIGAPSPSATYCHRRAAQGDCGWQVRPSAAPLQPREKRTCHLWPPLSPFNGGVR